MNYDVVIEKRAKKFIDSQIKEQQSRILNAMESCLMVIPDLYKVMTAYFACVWVRIGLYTKSKITSY